MMDILIDDSVFLRFFLCGGKEGIECIGRYDYDYYLVSITCLSSKQLHE